MSEKTDEVKWFTQDLQGNRYTEKGLKTDLSDYIVFFSLYQKYLSWEKSRKFGIKKIKPIHM